MNEDAEHEERVDCKIPHQLERETSASEDTASNGCGLSDPTSIGEGNKTFFIMM